MSGYAKDFAAFANNSGGYIVFGIQSSPHIPIGLQNNHFETTDEAKIAEYVNGYFSPAIEWTKSIHVWNKKNFGIIHVTELHGKPIIATKNGQEIKEGEIYYRYTARTEKIHYAELKQIIDVKIKTERDSWHRLFERIAKIGPENAAILDTLAGKIESGNRTILIGDELIPKLKFIREGQFDEKKGAITLRLIGDVSPVDVVGTRAKVVHDDPYIYRAKHVADLVAEAIGKTFRVNPEHVRCWKFYKIREVADEGEVICDPDYCEFKEAFSNFGYTQEWVDFLIRELSDPKRYREVISTKT